MTAPHLHESQLPAMDLARLESCGSDRQALSLFAEELQVRIAQEVDDYHDAIDAQINETANQIALAVDDPDDHHYNGLVRHIRILKQDQLHFSVTSRPSYLLHKQVIDRIRELDTQRVQLMH